jgi:hypothetical protein
MTWSGRMSRSYWTKSLPPLKSSKFWPKPPKWEMISTSNKPLCPQPQGMREQRWPRYQQENKQFPKQNTTGTQMIWGGGQIEETSLYLPSSGETKKGQGQATKLFLYNRALMTLPLPFYSILKMQFRNIPQWTQSHRLGRFSSRTNF